MANKTCHCACGATSDRNEWLEDLERKDAVVPDEETIDQRSIRDLVIDIRRYVIHHGILLGECVAWEKLKKLVDVGQTADCPSESVRK